MRILLINTNEKKGGAAVATYRLMEALNNNGVKAKMLVSEKETDSITVVELPQGWRQKWNFLWERLCIFCRLHFSRKHLFEIDIANTGTDITTLPEFQEADIIHLNWINQGTLSLKNIRQILQSGKPVVWTMHDIWPATAICHLTFGCERFKKACMNCPYLPKTSLTDLAKSTWKRKAKTFDQAKIIFVTCSKWLQNEAKESALLKGKTIKSIPNPIDTHVFRPTNKQAARQSLNLPQDSRLILFVSQRVTNVNKGMDYLIDACQTMASSHPELVQKTGVIILGGHAEEMEGKLPFKVWPMGYVSDTKRIVDIYNASDVFVLPSLSENLPNTIMEAMACGIPCVGFQVGGIPEEIDHQENGYVARYKDAKDLANGINWVLYQCDYTIVSQAAIGKVAHNYSQNAIALKYINVYNEALSPTSKAYD